MDTEEFKARIKMVTPLIAAFPNARGVTPETFTAYAAGTADLDPDLLRATIGKAVRTCKFLPVVSEVMDIAAGLVGEITGKRVKDPDEAWKEVLRQIQVAFVYKKPEFSAPEIEQAAQAFGWTALCNVPVDGMNTARAQFLRIYEGVCSRRRDRAASAKVLNMMPPAAKEKIALESTGAIVGRLLPAGEKKEDQQHGQ